MSITAFATELIHESDVSFDDEADIVVVGSGAGAFSAAITASKHGASVIQLEKAVQIGGTTKKAAAAYWVPNNHFMRRGGRKDPKADAMKYMARLTRPASYDPAKPHLGLTEWEYRMTEAFYDNAGPAVEQLTEWGALEPVRWEIQPDYYAEMPENKAPYGRIIYPHLFGGDTDEVGDGSDMIKVFANAAQEQGIDLRTGHRVSKAVVNDHQQVVGVIAQTDSGDVAIRARKAVIFASGGFTHNVELRTHSLPGPVFSGCAAKSNTGDFIPIAQALGAELVNMNGSWLAPMVLDRAIANRPDATCSFSIPGDSMIFVNRFGRRVVNEKAPYQDIVPTFWAWESQKAHYPNLVLVMLWDEETRLFHAGDKYGNPIGRARSSEGTGPDSADASHILQAATLAELENKIRDRLNSFASHTGDFNLDESFLDNLHSTIERFNGFAENGCDEDFHRGETAIELYFNMGARPGNDKNETLWPISAEGPYYATLLAPATLDTKGGPRTDVTAQVLNRSGAAIDGLYAVGNCAGAMSGGSYWAGGATLGPIITMGYVAGLNAARQKVRAAPEKTTADVPA
ncbi:FAD-dependent oxidoreductase [Pseudomonas sp.]|uniref:FAD-dependent oxidoreductase n=1 Tax=Pseudomonas sp. TaxID=306 RepID=UPI002616947E|nr:FAD-dependent oxidoreductase [Pseudomonas sp.]